MDVLVVNENPPRPGVVKAIEDTEDSGFSTAGGTDNGNFFASRYSERKVPEDRSIRVISKSNIVKAD